MFVVVFVPVLKSNFALTILGKLTLDGANEQLRAIIMRIWPRTSEELLDKIVPKAEGMF